MEKDDRSLIIPSVSKRDTWFLADYITAPLRVMYNRITGYFNMKSGTETKQHVERLEKVQYLPQLRLLVSGPSKIDDNIYLGSAIDAASYHKLKSLNIKYIINMTEEVSFYHPKSFDHYRYSLLDDNVMSIKPYLQIVYEKIEELKANRDGNILIHCMMGASRSATIVLYYLMKTQNIDVHQALAQLKLLRPGVNITQQFFKDLVETINTTDNLYEL